MRVCGISLCLAFALSAAGILNAEDKPSSKLEWKGQKGDAALFSVQRNSTTESQGGQREGKSNDESEIQYKIQVAESKDGGNCELKINYVSVKSKQDAGDRKFEFDSSKKEGGDETATALREAMGRQITVKISGGKISEVTGFPEVTRPEGGQRNFQGFGARMLVSRRGLEQDLDLILARAVQGQALEKGKEYRLAREEGDAAAKDRGQGQGRGQGRGMFGRGDSSLLYKYEGNEEVGGQAAAKFSLAADNTPRPGGDGNRPATERKSEGKALVSIKDGILLKLEVKSESKSEGEFNGNSFKRSTSSKTVISRGAVTKPKEATV